MFKDISFGQYYPADSALHKADPRVKLLLLVMILVFIFLADNFASILLIATLVVALVAFSKIPVMLFVKNLKPVIPVIIIASLLNIIYVKDGTVLFNWHFITVSDTGIFRAVFIFVRIVLLIVAGGLLTYTTTPTQLTAGLESIFSPLKFIGLGEGVHTLAMMMTIALRFIPTLIEESQKIIAAQRSRGADFESGSFAKRIKALVPVLIPLLISSVRRAMELADAMDCRCYHGGKGRTHYKCFKMRFADYLYFIAVTFVCIAVIVINAIL